MSIYRRSSACRQLMPGILIALTMVATSQPLHASVVGDLVARTLCANFTGAGIWLSRVRHKQLFAEKNHQGSFTFPLFGEKVTARFLKRESRMICGIQGSDGAFQRCFTVGVVRGRLIKYNALNRICKRNM